MTSNDLDGASFISEQVVGRELVLGSRIKLDVEGDMLGVSAGCNVLFGGLVLEADELRWAGSPRRP